MQALLCCLALLSVADEKYETWVSEPGNVAALPASAAQRLTSAELAALAKDKPTLPYADPTVGVRAKDGAVWVGSAHGLMYRAPGGERWRLFHSRRWLPDDEVSDIALTAQGGVFVKTPKGIGKLSERETTLEQKMIEIDDTLQKYHLRLGMVAATQLKEPGKAETGKPQATNDNDGLWTCIYVAAEAFRFAVTGDAAAKKNARRSLEALMFLERVSGIPGFAARSIVPIDDDPQKYRGEWHRSADNRWWWKGDTSSDEVDGHYFAYSIYYDVAADDEEKAEIRQYVARITDHILDHGLYYIGPPGVPTTWGVWAPEKLNHDLRRIGDRGLNSLEILSHLKVAEHICGNPRYTEKIKELVEKHSYATNTVLQKATWPENRVNHSDDELAFLAYYPLLIYERDEDLRTKYLMSIQRTWTIERPERSPLWNFIYGAALQANTWTNPLKRPDKADVDGTQYDLAESIEWLRDVPQDTTHWTITNSDRQDIGPVLRNRFRRARAQMVLPVHERPIMRWNGDPYSLDEGGEGRARDDGAAILLPYWMGRYHRFLD